MVVGCLFVLLCFLSSDIAVSLLIPRSVADYESHFPRSGSYYSWTSALFGIMFKKMFLSLLNTYVQRAVWIVTQQMFT